jgi:HEAT repeat protein
MPKAVTGLSTAQLQNKDAHSAALLECERLVDLLKSAGAKERVKASRQLCRALRKPAFAIKALADALKDSDPEVRFVATDALADCGTDAIPFFLQAISSQDEECRRAAARGFWLLGPLAASAAPELKRLLSHPAASVRAAAVNAVHSVLDAEGVPLLVKLLEREQSKEGKQAVYSALVDLGPAARMAIPILDVQMRTSGGGRHYPSIGPGFVIGSIGADAGGTLSRILDEKSLHFAIHLDAARSLRLIPEACGSERESAVPALTRALETGDSGLRVEVMATLAVYGRLATRAVPTLQKLCAESSGVERLAAAVALNRIQPGVIEYSKLLIRSLQASDSEECRAALEAVDELEKVTDDLRRALTGLLGDSDAKIRSNVARLAGKLGRSAVPTIPLLGDLLRKEQNEDVRRIAEESIQKLRRFESVAKLVEELEGEALHRRVEQFPASQILRELNGEAVEALAKVVSGNRNDLRFRVLAINVLSKIAGANPASCTRALPSLLETLPDAPPQIVAAAAETIGRMGHEGRSAIPRLQALLDDQTRENRIVLAEALGWLEPSSKVTRTIFQENIEKGTAKQVTEAIGAMQRLRLKDSELFHDVMTKLEDRNQDVRNAAINALVELWTSNSKVLERMESIAVTDESYEIRVVARWAAKKCDHTIKRSRFNCQGDRSAKRNDLR